MTPLPQPTRVRATSRSSRFVAGVLLVGGVFFLALAGPFLYQAWAARSWSVTPGLVTGSRIQQVSRAKSLRGYAVQIQYRYEVNGVRYEADNATVDEASLTAAHGSVAAAWQSYLQDPVYAPYQRGGRVTVYYDPNQPGNAMLRPGNSVTGWGLAILGLALLAIGTRTLWQVLSTSTSPYAR